MKEPLPSPEIWHGHDFALLCEWRRLTRIVEIGVDRGEFANVFLSRIINCEVYLGIDPYERYDEMPWDREADFAIACQRFERHANCAKLIRDYAGNFAEDAMQSRGHDNRMAPLYADPFDFVYIDAAHDLESVRNDLDVWWPLVSDKGILAGHDWDTPAHPDVQLAVRAFAECHDLQIYHTTADAPQCWYIYKNGIPGPDWKRC